MCLLVEHEKAHGLPLHILFLENTHRPVRRTEGGSGCG